MRPRRMTDIGLAGIQSLGRETYAADGSWGRRGGLSGRAACGSAPCTPGAG